MRLSHARSCPAVPRSASAPRWRPIQTSKTSLLSSRPWSNAFVNWANEPVSGAKMKRREFLQKGALVVAGAAAVVSGVAVVGAADQWTAGLKSLNPHEGETLLKVTRQIFPH